MVTRFPLLSLPNEAMLNVFRSIHQYTLMLMSLCSKRTKTLVKSLNIKVNGINVQLSMGMTILINFPNNNNDLFRLEVVCFNFNHPIGQMNIEEDLVPEIVRVVSPDCPKAYRYERPIEFRRQMTPRQWLDHFSEILIYPKIALDIRRELLEREGDNPYIHDIPKIENFLEGLKIRSLNSDNIGFTDKILSVLPDLEQLNLDTYDEPIKTAEAQLLPKIFVRNFDHVYFDLPVYLNHLFLINSKLIKIYKPILSDKDINKFIKNWIRGCNRRLEYLFVYYDFDEATTYREVDTILQGIKHSKVDEERMFKLSVIVEYIHKPYEKINRGYDIRRSDGTKATIVITGSSHFQMFVWP